MARKDPFAVGSFVHVMKRGTRGIPIVRDDVDRWRFLKLLKYLNDANVPRNWERDINSENVREGFSRPLHWPKPKPYVSILAFCLLDNHFHLLLRENVEDGISKFMQRLCTSMSANFNARHDERGTMFQGAYKARTVGSDRYLQYLGAYIQVKNSLERHPQGLVWATRDFDRAFEWAGTYPFASLIDYAGNRQASILDNELVAEIYPDFTAFRRFSRDVIFGNYSDDDEAIRLIFDE